MRMERENPLECRERPNQTSTVLFVQKDFLERYTGSLGWRRFIEDSEHEKDARKFFGRQDAIVEFSHLCQPGPGPLSKEVES